MKPLLLGALAFVVSMPLACGGAMLVTRSHRAEATKGWALVPVVVAAVDLQAGEALTLEQLSQRSMPEQFASQSFVRPQDAARIIGRKLNFPVVAGDPITWSQFTSLEAFTLTTECQGAIHPAVEAAGKAAAEGVLKEVREAPPVGAVEALPEPVADAAKQVKLLVAAEDLAEGATLSARHLVATDVPGYLATASLVPAGDLDSLAGARVLVPLQKGDLVAWVQLARSAGPQTVAGCAARVNAAVTEARRATAESEAQAFQPGGKGEVP